MKDITSQCEYTENWNFIAQLFLNEQRNQNRDSIYCIWGGVTWLSVSEWANTALSHTWVHVWLWAAGQIASVQAKQGWWSVLCQASPERGGWLGGGPFVGEVAGEDSLSFATSSPTCANTHIKTHSEGQWGSAVQEVKVVRQREVNPVYTTVTSEMDFA